MSETVTDSPVDWVARHIQRYVETDGAEGHIWQGVPTLLLTTLGRKSGQWRRTALIYGADGDRVVVVASKGGAPEHPAWFRNLAESPQVRVQVGADAYDARARVADGEERARLWALMVGVWPAYEDYRARTEREIPVVVLER